ncbi:sulfotransferase family protein [Frankia sp. AgB32]|uniref:sulfotransferase family protein n=1 Tax=Frankia sp. AgB32 TaxID=631119 RepID=UPI00200FD708|nr:sulfotransferase family protein [Frankia sp. AgB32]MCK9894233.1 sulfotransferase family protein [Frankia sp. AgB32]
MIDVIGAGFGRTGTLSLKLALEKLGFGPCHHMDEVLARRDSIPAWTAAAEGHPTDWDEMYAGYRSTVDWPGALFWRELSGHYPSARVILTVRDPEAWYSSVENTLLRSAMTAPPTMSEDGRRAIAMMNQVVWNGAFHGRFRDRDAALRMFTEHNESVKREIPADRLLVLDVTEGWEPLCAFLQIPVPDEPFPRLNDQASYAAKQRERILAAMGAPASR